MPWMPITGHFVVAKLDGKVRQVLATAWNSSTGAVRVDWPPQPPASSPHPFSRVANTKIDRTRFEPLDPEGFRAVTVGERRVGRAPTEVVVRDDLP